jgi:hypothetical protein
LGEVVRARDLADLVVVVGIGVHLMRVQTSLV